MKKFFFYKIQIFTRTVLTQTPHDNFFFLIIHAAWHVICLITLFADVSIKCFSNLNTILVSYSNLLAKTFKQKVHSPLCGRKTKYVNNVTYMICKFNKNLLSNLLLYFFLPIFVSCCSLGIKQLCKGKIQESSIFGVQNDFPFFYSYYYCFFAVTSNSCPHENLFSNPFYPTFLLPMQRNKERSSEAINFLSESH